MCGKIKCNAATATQNCRRKTNRHAANLFGKTKSKTDAFQHLMLTMLGAISEFERAIILERQKEGIAIAKAKGKYKGGVKKLSEEQINEIKAVVNDRKTNIYQHIKFAN